MANRAYLCGSRERIIYPSHRKDDYAAADQTIAGAKYCVPLLWLAPFRLENLTEWLPTEEFDEPVVAPVASKTDALAQFDGAAAWLVSLFAPYADLTEHTRLFREALESTRYDFITIEFDEIEDLHDPDTFSPALEGCLRYFADRPEIEQKQPSTTSWWARLFLPVGGAPKPSPFMKPFLTLTGIQPEAGIPPAKPDFDALPEQQTQNINAILGIKHIRPVPWY